MKLETGEFLVRLARKTIENFTNGKPVERPKKFPECLKKKRGVFCTLNAYPSGELRGCIGVPYPTMPLIDAVIEAAKGSCRDPRFFPLQKRNLTR